MQIFNVAAITRMVKWGLGYAQVLGDTRFIKGYVIEGDFAIAIVYSLVLVLSKKASFSVSGS